MKSTFLQKALLASTLASTVIFAASVQAQRGAPVVDLSASQSPKTAVQPSAAAGDSYYQSQMLQDEVRELRGMVEELSYELQRVKQRQMDDYLDIDRRLGLGYDLAFLQQLSIPAKAYLDILVPDYPLGLHRSD